MEKPVSPADANRKFSKLLRAVREGQSYVVTSHGRAVARIVPAEKNSAVTRGARAALLKRLRSEPVVNRWPLAPGRAIGGSLRVALDTNVLAYAELFSGIGYTPSGL